MCSVHDLVHTKKNWIIFKIEIKILTLTSYITTYADHLPFIYDIELQ